MKQNIIIIAASALSVMSCGNSENQYSEEQLLGEWHEVMPVNTQFMQGMLLEKDNIASSVGMATLKYSNWQLSKGENGKSNIILSGESIGNGQTIQFTDTLDIISLSNDTLTLGKGDMYRIQYTRATDKKSSVIGGSDAAKGYSYSKVLDKKIRIFEEGTRMLSATDPNSSYASYIVFPSDSSKVELFMPEESVVLDKRTRPDGTSVWNVEDDDTYMLEKSYDEWLITRGGKVLYTSTGFDNIRSAKFTDGKGNELSAKFFTSAGVAQITYSGQNYVLYQYVTASGYGYKNPFADIRGKGKDMTLSFVGQEKSINFTEE